MARFYWAMGLAALGLAAIPSSDLRAQTLGRPAVDVGPALMPVSPPSASVAPSGMAVGKSSNSAVPAPQPVRLPNSPTTNYSAPQAPSVRTSGFAEQPTVILPVVPSPAELPKVPQPPMPMPMPGSKLGPMHGMTPSPMSPSTVPSTLNPPLPGAPVGTTQLPTPMEVLVDSGTKDKANDFTPKFKFKPGDNNLLHMETANGLFKFFAGGRLQIDGVWLRTDDAVQAPRDKGGIGNVRDAVNFRRARFDFGGTFYENIDFFMQWDFINTVNVDPHFDPLPINTPAPTDLWVNFKGVPYVGNFRVGNQKPPISFEHLTSSRFLNFLERSLQFDAFVENQNNGFEPGISIFDTAFDERATWAVGIYKNSRSIFGWAVGDGEYQVTGRVTGLALYENEGERLVHFGLGASHRDLDEDTDRIRARTLLRNGPAVLHNIVAETRTLGSSRDQINPEFVVVWGPLTFQSEYSRVWVHDVTLPLTGQPKQNFGTIQYQGAYGELLYFLTGEHQNYLRKSATFGRTTPHQSFKSFGNPEAGCETCDSGSNGLGAWQVGIRYSWLDMDNKEIRGSTVHDVTLGLNWFLNPYMKWQFNYSSLYRNAPNPANDGWVRGFGVRLAFDF